MHKLCLFVIILKAVTLNGQELEWIGSPEDFLPSGNITMHYNKEDCTAEFDSCRWIGQLDNSTNNQSWEWRIHEGVHWKGGCEVEIIYSHVPCLEALSDSIVAFQEPPAKLILISSYGAIQEEVCVTIKDNCDGTKLQYCFNIKIQCGPCNFIDYPNLCHSIEDASVPLDSGGCLYEIKDLDLLVQGLHACTLPCKEPDCPPDTTFKKNPCNEMHKHFTNTNWIGFQANSRYTEIDEFLFNGIGPATESGIYSKNLPNQCLSKAGLFRSCNIPSYEVELIIGNTYFIWVDGVNGTEASYELTVTPSFIQELEYPQEILVYSKCRDSYLEFTSGSSELAVFPGEEIQFIIPSLNINGLDATFYWSSSKNEEWQFNAFENDPKRYGPSVIVPFNITTYEVCLNKVEWAFENKEDRLCLNFKIEDRTLAIPDISSFKCHVNESTVEFIWDESDGFNYDLDLSNLDSNLEIINESKGKVSVSGFRNSCQNARVTLIVSNPNLSKCRTISKTLTCNLNSPVRLIHTHHQSMFLNCEVYDLVELAAYVDETEVKGKGWRLNEEKASWSSKLFRENGNWFFDPNELSIGTYRLEFTHLDSLEQCFIDKELVFQIVPCYPNDIDGDGVDKSIDCDDENPNVYPGLEEICDGFDNNCNGIVDEGFELDTYYLDRDRDGFGVESDSLKACGAYIGVTNKIGDCDDFEYKIHPGAEEVCDDGIDNNCDGIVDDDHFDPTLLEESLECARDENSLIITWDPVFEALAYEVEIDGDIQMEFNPLLFIQYPDSIKTISVRPIFSKGFCDVEPVVLGCNLSSMGDSPRNSFCRIYPNPTFEYLLIDHPFDRVDYILFNISGQELESGSLIDSLDMRQLSEGIYLLKLFNRGNKIASVFRIIKL